ncbi:hypothetical protein GCM10009837_67530 [Streptomyces durmitorensis]
MTEPYLSGQEPDADHRVDCPSFQGCAYGQAVVLLSEFVQDHVARRLDSRHGPEASSGSSCGACATARPAPA